MWTVFGLQSISGDDVRRLLALDDWKYCTSRLPCQSEAEAQASELTQHHLAETRYTQAETQQVELRVLKQASLAAPLLIDADNVSEPGQCISS